MKLSSLVDLAFKLPANDRRLTFDAISAHCQVPSEEVRHIHNPFLRAVRYIKSMGCISH